MTIDRMDRRSFLALGAGLLGVAAAPAWLRPRERLVHLTVPVMGTTAELAIPSATEAAARQVLQAAAAELRRVEGLMTRFSAESEVGQFNTAPLGTRVALGPETSRVVREALTWADLTEGAFDPTLATLAEAWDPMGRSEPLSPVEREDASSRAGGWQELTAAPVTGWSGGPDGGTTLVRTTRGGLDLGGIAKGHAVDAATRVLRENGVFSGLVNVGGDLMAMGEAPGGRPWRVGVRDPRDPAHTVRTIEVTDRAVATSGDYLRFFEHEGVRYHHILDPSTGSPSRAPVHTVTVVASDVMTADAAATAAFVLGPAQAGPALTRASGRPQIVHSG